MEEDLDSQKEAVPAAIGMEFDSYDDVYNFYNCYAKEQGFGIRVQKSWCRRLSKEKFKAVLCCSNEGFTKKRSVNSRRAETRTGCPAMVRISLVGNFRWKVTQVVHEHNHLISPTSKNRYRSHKSVGVRIRKKVQVGSDARMQTSTSNQMDAVDGLSFENYTSEGNCVYENKQLELKEGDAQALYNYFCRMQLISPNFFYVMDLENEGCLGNVFWADARSRAAYSYFGDVVAFDTRYVANKYEVSCVPFVGLNNHGQSVLLGCGLLADETFESFVWLFKAWLSCMPGCPPFVIITDQGKTIQRAVMNVFPRARHCFSLNHVMQKAPQELRGVRQYEAVRRALNKAVYDSLRVDEFETIWKEIVEQCGVGDHEWLQTLYHDQKQWVPVFLKESPFAGLSSTEQNECMHGFFDGYLTKQTSLKEFFGKYESALEKKRTIEAREDFDSLHSKPILKTKCCFELQMSRFYTKEIFRKFQHEVEELYSCFNTSHVHSDGPIVTYVVKERCEGEGNQREVKNFEVLYNTEKQEVSCICGLFNFKGYLCRHTLSVLNYNGVEEIPSHYIISRWRKDYKHSRIVNAGANSDEVDNRDQWSACLYKYAVQIVEEGAISQEHYKAALLTLEESLKKVCLAEEIESRMVPTTSQRSTT